MQLTLRTMQLLILKTEPLIAPAEGVLSRGKLTKIAKIAELFLEDQ
jgi:hypothetical protein